ncbi:tripartite tricarboxylate transporter substrate binding protein [Bradyrhizobium sp. AUGA SZCCT0240]|nr:tripartite tricarboxylate transporter substrate binding protein [Bradyrhizobium sp. AUGA SZCCT0160]MBR1197900.1 tripartite tricarboxylate transporter substrate binding protein [Bradyrhizobium sp. AUGA SZCCT0158]MBR1240665.1 tripartite tricarboxylate transporter substrate binding protein [Bradyrhizobium sp. AUGA SZCCT0274]MBR1255089.1 tripartite tricarboxylate transporter substrate binding protein [Bradyrhizobium sp. AUGA SZCCT0240]
MVFIATIAGSMCAASAQDYPTRPIRLLHGFAAGGAADTLSRILANGLSKRLGQPIVIEAKPGSGGNLAAAQIAKAEPDGYTIGLVTGAHAISPALYKSLPYDSVESFEMISTAVYYALVIAVRADYEAKSLGELIALARAKPGELNYASVGFGSTHHLAGALLETTAGIRMVHVPYRGDSLTVTALLGGEIPMIVGTPVLLAPQIESGAIRGLAVTSPARSKLLPNVPTADESGVKGFDVRTWAGLLAPKGTPPAIIKRLNKAVLETLADPETRAALETAIGGEVQGSTPEEMRALIQSQIVKWADVIKTANIPRL